MSHSDALSEIETAIRGGQVSAAARLLHLLKPKRLSRPNRVRYANLARRCEVPHLALRVLRPIVLPPKGIRSDATAEEISEYAASLIQVGATDEGLAMISAVDPKAAPESLLFRAFALFGRWDYAAAIPHLENFVQLSKNPYRRLVGQVNLVAALAAARAMERAELELGETIRVAHEHEAFRLLGNCHELQAQIAIDRGDHEAAEAALKKAQNFLGAGCIDGFLVEKWRAIAGVRRGIPGAIEQLAAVRDESLRIQHWEGARDCDFHLAVKLAEPELLEKVYFGTPHAAFRERIVSAARGWSPPASFAWKLGDPGSRTLDLCNPLELARDLGEGRSNGLLSRTLLLLATDFYAPFRPASVFAAIFPYEHFNESSSPHRVHELVSRVRKLLAQKRGLKIVSLGQGYALAGAPGTTLMLPGAFSASCAEEAKLALLHGRVGDSLFSIAEAASTLGVSNRTANRLLADWIAQGEITRSGVGRATQYRLAA